MSFKNLAICLMLTALLGGMWTGSAFGQDRDDDDRGRRGGFGRDRGGRPTPEQIRERIEESRQRFMDMLKERMGASDEEWAVIAPRIEAVQEAQAKLGGRGGAVLGFLRGRGGFGGRGGPGRFDRGRGDRERDRGDRDRGDRDRGDREADGDRDDRDRGDRDRDRRRGRGRGADLFDREPSEVEQKMRDLREVLQEEDAAPEKVQTALAAYRNTKRRAEANLNSAQDELQSLLLPKQEALLVMMGLLD